MLFVIEDDGARWLVELPESVSSAPRQLQSAFMKWIKRPDSKAWQRGGLTYGISDFVDWVNDIKLADSAEKAVVVNRHAGEVTAYMDGKDEFSTGNQRLRF
ncbi:MAG: hypothetical protein LBN02_00865 [Oscillospiraceae bacterium]|jgi:hypothetical protein|nr:hypothetical protein [Oscillospiraceae bacterium]